MTEQVFIRAEIIGTNPAGQKHVHLLATGADGIHFWTDDKSIVRTARPDEQGVAEALERIRGEIEAAYSHGYDAGYEMGEQEAGR